MPKEYGGLHYEDGRWMYVLKKCWDCLNLKIDTWGRFIQQEANQVMLTDFFDKPDAMSLIFYVENGNLSGSDKWPKKLSNKGLLIGRINPGKVEASVAKCGENLWYGEVPGNAIEYTSAFIEEVILGLLTSPKIIANWPDVVTDDVKKQALKIKNRVFIITGQMTGKTLLALPPGIDQCEINKKFDVSKNRSLIHTVESAIVDWTALVRDVLKEDAAKALGKYPTPENEVQFWMKRFKNLDFINQQLQQKQIKKMATLLNHVGSTYYTALQELISKVTISLEEALDIKVHLNPICGLIGELEQRSLEETIPCLKALYLNVSLIWRHSKFFNTPTRIVILLREVSNLIIEHVSSSLGSEDVLSQDPEDFYPKMDEAFTVCKTLKSRFNDFKTELNNLIEEEDLDLKPITVPAFMVFDRMNRFMKRMTKVKTFFHTTLEFMKLEKVVVGGLRGRFLTSKTEEIFKKFNLIIGKFNDKPYDPLDPDNPGFDNDFAKLNADIGDLEQQLSTIVCKGFEDCSDLESAIKLTQIWGSLLERPLIRQDFNHNFIKILDMYNKDLDDVKVIFDKHVREYHNQRDGYRNPQRLLIYKNNPPVSGELRACKHIRDRINSPIEHFLHLNHPSIMGEPWETAMAKKEELEKMILEFEESIFQLWAADVDKTCEFNLAQNLLTRDRATMFIETNFSPKLVAVLCEVKYLTKLGRTELPALAEKLYSRNEAYMRFVGNLNLLVEAYNGTRRSLLKVEYPLVAEQIAKIDQVLVVAEDYLNWEEDGLGEPMLTGAALLAAEEEARKAAEAAKLEEMLSMAGSKITTMDSESEEAEGEEGEVKDEAVEDVEEADGMWNYDPAKDKTSYKKSDTWEYIEGVRDTIMDLHFRVDSTHENIDRIQALMDEWAKTPLFERKQQSITSNLLDLDGRKDRVTKKYGIIKQDGIKIHAYVAENAKFFRADVETDIWKAYKVHVDQIVVKGFHQCLKSSIMYLMDNTEPHVQPLFTANLELDVPEMVFNPSLDPKAEVGFRATLKELFNDIYHMSTQVERISENTDRVHYLADMESLESLVELKFKLWEQMKAALHAAYDYSQEFMIYSNLWLDDRKELLKQFLTYGRLLTMEDLENAAYGLEEKKPTLEAFKKQMDSYEDLHETIGNYRVTETFNGWFLVHIKPFIKGLQRTVREWGSMFKEHLINHVRDSLMGLQDFIIKTDAVLSAKLVKGDYDGLVQAIESLSAFNERQEATDVMFEPLKHTIDLLKTYKYDMSEEILKLLTELPERWAYVKKLAVVARQVVTPLEANEMSIIRRKCGTFDQKQLAFREKFRNEGIFKLECGSPYRRLDILYRKIMKLFKEQADIEESAAIFGVDVPEYRQLQLCRREIAMCKQVWDLAYLIMTSTNDWNYTLWKDINVDEMDTSLKAFAKDIRGLDKETRSWPIYLSLDDLCKNLMVSLKAIGDLQNPAIRDRHWQQLQIATKVEFEMTEETTLEDLLKLHLHKFEEDVNEIVDKAVKEMAMEKTMKELNATWKNMRFDYSAHPRTGLPLIVCSEELMDTLEDNQVQVQGLMNSKFVGFFLDEVSYWAATLACADAVLAVWLDVQRTWAHLESIFIASEDIRKQLPEDAARFDELDKDFKEILQDASKTPIVTEATGKEGLQETLDGIKEKLVMCEKSLAEYLETKRLAFPRFYFISSSDLLDILSNGNNPREVAKHLSKLFDNMVNMRFQGTGKIADAMYSSEGEEVPFSDPILCDGQVEAWLSKLLEQMRLTIRCALSDAVMGYEEKPRDQWLFDYPAQACLTATQIWWATEVGIAFSKLEEGYENALKDYYKKQVQQLNTLIGHLCGFLNKQNRQSIMTVCTMDVHARDVVGKLILLKIESSSEFVWQSQLRHRWDDFKRHCFANICDAQFRYSYEYLGNCPRLVITPLTDRCYITQTQSLHLIMGAAPAGPAGTGKTETTKDLARTLAIMIYVFNCSEQMDYKSVGNIFKGLSQTGAWGCFDEFNRITVEVLSVVAVQVKSIQEAIKYKKKRFIFQGEEISLTPTIGVFITMNPGYAGRTELPENLKALFRPCAMVVPDFELICEIMLVAEGFTEARILARKFLTLYTLCKQLLSKQDHYDWGLRAIKSVLVVAGALKRGDKDRPEDQVLMRALRDFNIPKIVTDDMPVFMGLIGDLFPGVNVPRKLDLELEADCKQAVIDLNLQPEDSFVLKLVQLDELLYVRHSVFVIGQAGSGKTQVLKGLFRAYYNRGTKPVWQDLNPKAVTNDELFGIINPATREWKDGLFSTIMRDLSVIPGDGAKWIVLDGDIDPMWIESLNTVMDDNKILTLASNERIPVTPPMRLLFEISNLRTATPATVSRAGILFINPADLGWNPVVLSWLSKRSNAAERASLAILFDKYIPPVLDIFKTKFLTITPIMECAKIQMLLDLLDCLLVPSNIPSDSGKEIYELYFVFSCIWSFGGALFQDQLVDHRAEFSKWWIGEFKTIKFPPGGVVFDFFIDHETHKFVNWSMDVPKFELDPELPLQACMVPTSETRRIRFFMDVLMEKCIPVMLVGNAGAGKTVLVQSKLRALDDRFMVQNVPFNFYTTSAVLQGVLEKPLEKKAGRNYGPPGTKRMVYFIDDMNMPEVDLYGTVEPHTLIRQHLDYKHWYDRVKLSLKEIHNVQYVSCMNPTAGSFTINPRLQRHFCVLAVSFPGKEATTTIYKNILVQHFNLNSFPRAVKQQAATIVAASIALHEKITSTFLPTAVKFHYVFNLRDLSNLFQGLLFAFPECIRNANDIVRMWMHEISRVYGDKMINTEDVDEFLKIRDFFAGQFFESIPENVLLKQPLLFCHFSKGQGEIKYGPVHEWKDMNRLLVIALDQYNEWNAQMNLVLFEDAMAHVVRINRILESPRGNALLVGVGGSGKQSLSRLAASISGLEVFQITLRKGYGMADLKADINNLYMRAGIKNIGMMFLLTDAQVGDELFLVLVNDLLASGEIPDLFGDDEIDNIINGVRPAVKAAGIEDSSANCWKFFIDRVRKQLKTVLCFSPVGSTLRIRGRKFPALVNCTQIDWFLEWPDEALQSVALTFLKDIKNIGEEVKPSVAEFMAHVHQTVNISSDQYRQNERRYNYTTPKSYLEQIFLYKSLMKIKGSELDAKTERLENGIMKLEDTSGKVDDLKDKLKFQEVELKAKNEAADQLIEVVGVETAKVTKEKEFADEEEAKVSVIAVEVGQKQVDCERDLEKAEPALLAAVEALNTLNKNNLTELKSFGSPPAAVVQVTAAVMCLLSTNGKVPKDRSWKACKIMMAKVDAFLDQLINYNKENIHKNCLKEVRPYLANPEFNPDFIRAKSGAAAGLCSWVINIVIFYEVFCDVEPKRNALAQANADLKAAKDKLEVINNKLRELDDNLAELTAKYEEAIGEKLRCQQEAEATELTINLANRLVGGLSSENVRWRKAVAEFKDQANRLSGDVLMITAFISYVGYFTKVYRTDFFENQWHPFMKKQKVKIPITDKLDPVSVLVDDADFAKWSDEGLPLDRMSIENATIMTSCARWPLIIDPQLQGIAWIKRRYASNIRLVRLDKKGYLDSIEAGLEQGNTVVLESIGQTIDPVLAPVLGRETIKKGKYIKIGDKEVSYHPNFKLILQTNLANPHYQPELQAQCTLINFTVTRDGLEDQLLAKVVNAERPDLEELKAHLTSQQNSFVVTLKDLEDSLLSRLSSASGNFLGDTALVENLEFTKKTAADIEKQVAEAKTTEVKINEAREFYRPIAIRAALLYFILNELNCCHPIYQFSLKSFNVVFSRAIKLSEQSDELEVRINNLIDTTTLCVYQYTARGLFERDKLTFTAKIAFEILLTAGEISRAEYNHLLVFPVKIEGNSPVPFLSNLCWGGICALSELDEFRGLDKDIEGSAKRWKKFSDSEVPEKEKFPPEWKGKNSLQKLMIMRALRPDRMTYAVTLFVEEQLGRVYVENRSIEFSKSFEESGPETPMFFVLSPGVDPLKDVEALGRKLGWHTDRKNFHNVSLGQGQEVVAEAAIDLSAKRGHWVILQNVHLVARWLATLEKKVEQKSFGSHKNYRLFISAEPASNRAAHILPQGILDCSIKITNEPPTGMQANLHKALDNFNEDTMEMCSREIEFKSILQSLCYFHAVLMERKKFGAQGWNRPYPFNVGDLTICVDVLYNYLETATKVPWDDLRYLFCEIMYGGHITDDWDRKLCKTYLEIFMHPDQLDGELLLAPGYPVPPNLDYKGYHAYIDDNLPAENPSLYGLHPNAEIGVLTAMSNYLFESILDLEPKDSGGGGDGENTREELVKQFIDEAFERLPGEFKIAEMLQKCQDRTPFIIVAFQECERMNFLTSEMTRSLHELKLGLKGELTVTAAMEELEEGIFYDRVPENWSNLAYPSSAGLSVWFADLLCRIRELENWTAEFNLPNSVWLGGLFNPQSFLTAIMQAIARKNEWPLDKMCLQCDPTKKMSREDITAPPREGAYIHGLFMEGARWDIQTTSIAESRPKEMMPPVPILFIRAIPVDRLDMKNVYECPVYKTKIRGPTFVWTFNLKTKEKASKWVVAGVALLLQD